MVHLVLFTVFVYTAILFRRNGNKCYALMFGFIILFFFAALRYGYGNDYFGYEKIFIEAQKGINISKVEKLFFSLNRIFPSYQLLIATLSLVYLIAVYYLIMKFSHGQYFLLSVFIFLINPYLFLMSLSAIRQTLVVSFLILLTLVEPKRKLTQVIVFVCTVFLSFFIHQTAILLLPFYFVYHGKINIKRDYIVFGILPVLLFLPNSILMYPINRVIQLLPSRLNYLHYINTNTPNSLRATLLFSVFYVYVLLNLKLLDKKVYPIARLYLCGLLFALLAYKFSMFTRFLMYFEIFGIVAIPAIFNANINKQQPPLRKLIHVYALPIAIFAIFVLRYYSFFTNDLWAPFSNYVSILSLSKGTLLY